MKKYIILAVASSFALPWCVMAMTTTIQPTLTKIAPTTTAIATAKPLETETHIFSATLKRGMTASDVSTLQTILKTDPVIYPAGLVTGYYGPATEAAVKKLQNKYDLPETGIVDEATQAVIYPDPSATRTEITILMPNGGEIWSAGDTAQILWKSTISPITAYPMPMPGEPRIMMNGTGSVSSGSSSGTAEISPIKPTIVPPPFFPYASIDLIRDTEPSYLRHIGSANLYQTKYSWSIPKDIPEASDYRVRISVGKNVPCLYRSDVETKQGMGATSSVMPPRCAVSNFASYYASDTSDKVFAVKGGSGTDPAAIAELRKQIAEIKMIMEKLSAQISAIEAKLGNM
ncbi:MAG: peptidoglycan-binding protein [Candidatus Paceibacterota bacterium]